MVVFITVFSNNILTVLSHIYVLFLPVRRLVSQKIQFFVFFELKNSVHVSVKSF